MKPVARAVRILTAVLSAIYVLGILLSVFAIQLFGSPGAGAWSFVPWLVVLYFSLALTVVTCYLQGLPWMRQANTVALSINSALILILPFLANLFLPTLISSDPADGGQILLARGAASVIAWLLGAVTLLFCGLSPALSGWLLYLILKEGVSENGEARSHPKGRAG